MPTDVVLCKVDEIPDGGVRHFEIMGYDLAVIRLDGTFYGLDAACTYQWANLADGSVDRDRLVIVCNDCRGAWDLKTGKPVDPPAKFPLTVYEVATIGDDVILTFTY
jgi:3-phenylpropionate/trans-cinnamate dioxygenase ferredoxin component